MSSEGMHPGPASQKPKLTTAEMERLFRDCEPYLKSLYEESDPVPHDKLLDQQRYLAEGIDFRVAGYPPGSDTVDSDYLRQDAEAVSLLDGALTIQAHTVEAQITVFRDAVAKAGGDWDVVRDILAKEGGESFFEVGGQVRQISADMLERVATEGYVILAEYLQKRPGDARISRLPVGYHFGFPRMPTDEVAFPTLHPNSIAGVAPEVERLRKGADNTYTIWRTGVLRRVTDEVRDQMRELGFDMLGFLSLPDISFQRLGISTATKYISGRVAETLNRERVICNIGNLVPVSGLEYDLMDFMPNGASLAANRPLFNRLRAVRSISDMISDGEKPVGQVYWDIYANTPGKLVAATLTEAGVLKGKAGLNKERVNRVTGELERHLGSN